MATQARIVARSQEVGQRHAAAGPARAHGCVEPRLMEPITEKPAWVETLEESLLLAIVLFSLITWIVIIGVLGVH
jgi:hypothetical protein